MKGTYPFVKGCVPFNSVRDVPARGIKIDAGAEELALHRA